MPEETLELNIDKLVPRSYQIPIFKAMDQGVRQLAIVMHRRAGKDLIGINIMLREALKRVGSYAYILPTYRQAKDIIWQGMTKDGTNFLDYIPKELIRKKNQQDMSIQLINGSRIYLKGSNKYDSLRGMNPVGIVFSEFAYQHPSVYPTIRPVVVENGGWMFFQSTPFGENHFYDVYKAAQDNPKDWFAYLQTVKDTGVLTAEQIQQEIDLGLMSPDMVQQEYYCDFTVGAVGAYYATYLNFLYLKEQIDHIAWDRAHKVHTAWDIGMDDETVIIFFQLLGRKVHIIDLYHNSNVGLEHYAHYLKTKDYVYGTHIAPHDMKVRDISMGGQTRWDLMNQLGITFEIAPNMTIYDGIETVRSQFNRLWIDEPKCRRLISALRDYRKEYDERLKKYRNKPLHDHNSHFADALRYLSIYLPFIQDGMSEQDAERIRKSAFTKETYSVFDEKGPYRQTRSY